MSEDYHGIFCGENYLLFGANRCEKLFLHIIILGSGCTWVWISAQSHSSSLISLCIKWMVVIRSKAFFWFYKPHQNTEGEGVGRPLFHLMAIAPPPSIQALIIIV